MPKITLHVQVSPSTISTRYFGPSSETCNLESVALSDNDHDVRFRSCKYPFMALKLIFRDQMQYICLKIGS